MEKEITIYHVLVFDITKDIEYPDDDYGAPEAEVSANIQQLYSFKTQAEADAKRREIVKYIDENREAFGISSTREYQVMTWNSKLVL